MTQPPAEGGVGQSGFGSKAGPGNGDEAAFAKLPVAGIPDAAKAVVHDAMGKALAHGLKTQTECLLTLDATTGRSVYNQVDGSAGQVQIPASLVQLLQRIGPKSIVVVHNHPSSSSFSDDDLGVLGNYESLRGLAAVGHDGTSYYIGRTTETGGLNPRVLVLDWHRHVTKYIEYYAALIREGQMTEEQAWKEHSHQAVQDLAREHGLEYVRWSRQ